MNSACRPSHAEPPLSFGRKLLLISLLIGFSGVVLNWPRPSERPERAGGESAAVAGYGYAASGRTAGMPFTFYVVEENRGARWEAFPLALNALAFAVAALFSAAAIHLAASAKARRRLQTPLSRGVAAGMGTLVAAGLAGVVLWGQRQDGRQHTAHHLELYGTVSYATRVSPAVSQYLPASLGGMVREPVSVTLNEAPSTLLRELATLNSISEVSLHAMMLVPADLRLLAELPSLRSLQLDGCRLEEDHCREIAALPSLEQLRLTGCRGSELMAQHLDSANRLTDLKIDRLPWSAAGEFQRGFGSRIRSVELGFVDARGPASLAIVDRATLSRLRLFVVGEPAVDAELSLRVSGLPNLRELALPRRISLDLDASDLPLLQQLDAYEFRHRESDVASLDLRFRRLSLRNLPRLFSLRCEGERLEQVELSGVPELRTMTLASGTTRSRSRPRHSSVTDRGRATELIRMLGECDGPETLDLSSMSLHQTDLAPLVANHRLRQLVLTDTDVTAAQLCSLSGMTQLKSLDIRRCGILDGDIEQLLTALPGLRTLDIETARVTRLELRDHPNLQTLAGTNWNSLRSLSIAGCPNLRGGFDLAGPLEKLHLRDARSLERLRVRRSLPADTVLDGFQSLQALSLRGERVTDELIAAFAGCFGLTELKLTETALSDRGVAELGRFRELTSLEIPGAPLSEAVAVTWWTRMPGLRVVDVSRTQIAGETLRCLAVVPNLQRLDVSHTQLQEGDCRFLTQLDELVDLDAAGMPVSPESLIGLVELGRLDRLNVSDRVIDEPLKRALADCAPLLLYLGVERCSLSDDDVRALLDASPRLAIGAKGNFVSADTRREMRRSGRWIDAGDRRAFQARLDRLAGVTDGWDEDEQGGLRLVRTSRRQRNRTLTAPTASRSL